jgi:hypothetical protein
MRGTVQISSRDGVPWGRCLIVFLALPISLSLQADPHIILPSDATAAGTWDTDKSPLASGKNIDTIRMEKVLRSQEKRAREMKPKVVYRYDGPNGLRIKVEGDNLATADRDALLSADPESHKREIKRILQELKPIVGAAANMEFQIPHWNPVHPKLFKNSTIYIGFVQWINSVQGLKSTIAVSEDNRVIFVQLAYLDPSQANLSPEYWLPQDVIVSYARHAILSYLGEDKIIENTFRQRRVHFEETDEEMTVIPIFSFMYSGYLIRVNGISGECVITKTARH